MRMRLFCGQLSNPKKDVNCNEFSTLIGIYFYIMA